MNRHPCEPHGARSENAGLTSRSRSKVVRAAVTVFFFAPFFNAAQLSSAAPQKTRAQVVSQLSLRGSAVVEMFTERERGRTYLYLRRNGGNGLTAVDITHLKAPRFVEHQPTPKQPAAPPRNKLGEYTAFETVEQVEVRPAPLPDVTPKALRLVDVTDPNRPFAGQIFPNVTAVLGEPDNHRIFIASLDTLYFLQERRKGACEEPVEAACGIQN